MSTINVNNTTPYAQTPAGQAASQAAADAASAAASGSSGTDVAATQNNFLKLLVTQLQNQDPLNPADNSQITSQLAQLSTVTGVNQLNSTLTALQTSYQSSEALQATSLISHGVLAAGTTLQLVSGKDPADSTGATKISQSVFGVNFGSAADKAEVQIKDSTGKVVKTIEMSNAPAGPMPLTWDGKADDGTTVEPDGTYSISVTASAGGAALKDASTLTYGIVASVSSGSGGIKLNVSTPLGSLNLSDIQQVL
ncbi:flagellar hook assembly protein FlgD [Rugamonas sp.]|uniref:flagellar hook assembly protein FlgD n=1 Tax=Rugamonas sp. TaxID=1926287 RepID=UPI0025D24310|nr:flagellar hook assembly protein FlgD [Rugamonas sp.]